MKFESVVWTFHRNFYLAMERIGWESDFSPALFVCGLRLHSLSSNALTGFLPKEPKFACF